MTSFKFHRKCIDNWLLHKCNSCPIDGQVIYNPLIWKDTAKNGQAHQSDSNIDVAQASKQEEPELFIPCIGLVLKQNRHGILPSIHQCNSEKVNTSQSPTDSCQNLTEDDAICSTKLDDSKSKKGIYECKISQHFPTYLQDLPTRPLGKISHQTFLPSIAQKNIFCSTRMEPSSFTEKYPTNQNWKTTKTVKCSKHTPKKTVGTQIREENKRTNTLLPEDLSLTINWGITKLSLSERSNPYKGGN